jgi:hybrid cluster-associated redox disulfide protein
MSGETPLGQMSIADVLERWPETARVFQEYRMACVGCVVAPFFTLVDAASVYQVSPEQFLADMAAAIAECRTEREQSVS